MRIAYLLSADPFAENGVNKKVRSQVVTWKELGHNVQCFSILVNRGKRRKKKYFEARIYPRRHISFVSRSIVKDMDHFNPDIVYIRFEILKPFLLKILKRHTSVLEINSDDRAELKLLARGNMTGKMKYLYNILTREWLFYKISGIVSVSHELLNRRYINRFNRPRAVIPNSIYLDDITVKKKGGKHRIPRLLFMGSAQYCWYGIDKIIRLAEQTRDLLYFHIIGPYGDDFPRLANVRFHGYLVREEYERIIEKCDIGIGAMALHRKNMNEASSLKLLEYLAYGLPSIVGNLEAVFKMKEYPEWILKLENVEENVHKNMQRIVDFCYKNKDVVLKKSDVYEFVDSHVIEGERCQFFQQIRKEKKR